MYKFWDVRWWTVLPSSESLQRELNPATSERVKFEISAKKPSSFHREKLFSCCVWVRARLHKLIKCSFLDPILSPYEVVQFSFSAECNKPFLSSCRQA